MTDHLFVYGTLQPGGERWSRIADLVDDVGSAHAPGTLVATPHGWPAATFGGQGTVHGYLLAIRDGDRRELLERCDAIESVGTLFRRVLITVDGPDGPVDAFAYEWLGPGDPPGRPVPGGRWPEERQ